MSLVTISSANLPDDPTSQSSSYIQNNYKEGIVIRPGDTVALVSLSINKENTFRVNLGINDSFIYRLGARNEGYEQIKATLDAGDFTGHELAQNIQNALNRTTYIGCLKQFQVNKPELGGWSVSYLHAPEVAIPKFTLYHTQQGVNALSGPQYSPPISIGTIFGADFPDSELNVNLSGEQTLITGNRGTSDMDDDKQYSNALCGDRGIFGNGGTAEFLINPILGMDISKNAFTGVEPTNVITVTNNGVEKEGVFGNPGGGNGWDWSFTYADGVTPTEYWRIITGDETGIGGYGMANGSFGIGLSNTVSATDPNNWTATPNILYYHSPGASDPDQQKRFQNTDRTGSNSGITYTTDDASGDIGNPMNYPVGFPFTRVGYCRQQIRDSIRDLGAIDGQGGTLTTENDGADLWIELENDPDHATNPAGFKLNVFQLKTTDPKEFPAGAWREASTIISDITPSTFSTLPIIPGATAVPANWSTFNFANKQYIKIVISIDYLNTITINCGHKGSVGSNEFTNILRTGPVGDSQFQSTIRDTFFPLSPCMTTGDGGYYDASSIILQTLSDHTEQFSGALWWSIYGIDGGAKPVGDPYYVGNGTYSAPYLDITNPVTAVILEQMYKFGTIKPADLVSGGGDLPNADAEPHGYISNLTGLDNYYFYSTDFPTVVKPLTGDKTPFTGISDPSISVELVDFNISGYNGLTGDTGKQIAFIPREQLETGDSEGVLHYYSRFPIDVELNVPTERTFYSLTAMLRTSDGKMAVGLLNPTEMTLLLKEGDESKQVRVMTKAMEAMRALQSDIQTNKISRIGNDNPLL